MTDFEKLGLFYLGRALDHDQFRDAAEFALYTPGSSSGRPLSIMKSFAAPDPLVWVPN